MINRLLIAVFIVLFSKQPTCSFRLSIFKQTTASKVSMSTSSYTKDVFMKTAEKIKESLVGKLPPSFDSMCKDFVDEYAGSLYDANTTPEVFKRNIVSLFSQVELAVKQPYKFQPYHQSIREPFDYYKFGNDFLSPLIISEKSKLVGIENAKKIKDIIDKGENVVILSNHQTEADPQVLSILLENEGEDMRSLAENLVFIAGHKVTNDPIAIPFSMGRNLICIHSKKHIKNPPEDASRKQAENLESMKAMNSLISSEKGVAFWVAPSGGRDRPDQSGKFVVSPFDAKALDMFKLQAMQSKKPMHFFPMAMFTHQLIPPPKSVSSALGEERSAKRGGVSVAFLDETDGLGGLKDKEFAVDLMNRVKIAYDDLCAWHYD